ncbi:hypothetical protein VST7929_01424 [Vibrio stylophorae]|uniref:Uncharacterized protein n=1 Tax=Vibrio stylophorae TaxID=659351 RepID=A0ABN8DTF6_9VIBR|nr:hypothetical protein [Vibrio stylophorae]CAH0533554.1 hypothetical protein VST7929_01424 [Vibrio stylophorae]
MSLFQKVLDFLGSGVAETVVKSVQRYFPPTLSEKERMAIENAIRESARAHELKLIALAQAEQQAFEHRLVALEGTASDLKHFGVLGQLTVFLRGLQRPLWGFFVLYLDYQVFIQGRWPALAVSAESELGLDIQSAFWMINFLVLGFLFGERAMRNVLPLLMAKKTGPVGLPEQAQLSEHVAKG